MNENLKITSSSSKSNTKYFITLLQKLYENPKES